MLLNVGFEEAQPLQPLGGGRRLKGWQAAPLGEGVDFGVSLVEGDLAKAGKKHVVLGCLPVEKAAMRIAQGAKAVLAQEIRNFRAGHYTLSAHVSGSGSSRQHFEEFFHKHFTCRLVYYRHTEATKSPLKRLEAASLPFRPEFADNADKYQRVEFPQLFDSRVPNVNFHVGLGFGVAVIVEKTSPGELELPAGVRLLVRVDEVQLIFTPRQRNDDVQV